VSNSATAAKGVTGGLLFVLAILIIGAILGSKNSPPAPAPSPSGRPPVIVDQGTP
jgi:hypothetical protein